MSRAKQRLPTPLISGQQFASRDRRFNLSVHAATGRNLVPRLRRHVLGARRLLKRCRLRELSIALVSDAEMKRLHNRYLKINTTTDVLTFELDHDHRGRIVSGEVIVCVPQARRQCRVGIAHHLNKTVDNGRQLKKTVGNAHPTLRRASLANEVLLLCLHGLLHLSGFDDKTDRQFKAMHRAEDRLLTRLGVGPVFGNIAKAKPSLRTDKR